MYAKIRRSQSFRFKSKSTVQSSENDVVLKKKLSKSIEVGVALFRENQELKKELEMFKKNQLLYNKIRSEIENRRKLFEMEKENLENQNYELRKQLNESRNENELLTKDNENLSRDLTLTQNQLNRVVVNNSVLRKEKKNNKTLYRNLGEKILSRSLSERVDKMRILEIGTKRNSFSHIPSTKSNPSPPTSNSDDSYQMGKRSRSLNRMKKTNDRDIRVQKRRICQTMKMMKDSVRDIKKELYQTNLWFSQTRFEGCKYLKEIARRKEEEKAEVSTLKGRIDELEKNILDKDLKHARQVENFIRMFEINKIYSQTNVKSSVLV